MDEQLTNGQPRDEYGGTSGDATVVTLAQRGFDRHEAQLAVEIALEVYRAAGRGTCDIRDAS